MQESVGIKTRELSRLYDIEIAADTLATLIRDHEQRKAQFEQDAAARKTQVEREMQESRAAWEKETLRIKEELAAERARANKEWQREVQVAVNQQTDVTIDISQVDIRACPLNCSTCE